MSPTFVEGLSFRTNIESTEPRRYFSALKNGVSASLVYTLLQRQIFDPQIGMQIEKTKRQKNGMFRGVLQTTDSVNSNGGPLHDCEFVIF
jgi:hypothetical protein